MKRSKYTLNKRKLLPIFAVVGILAGIGGVFAANQDSAIFPNLFNLGFQEAEYVETFTSPEDWKTCQEVPKTVVTTNNGTGNFKVRLSYDEYWRNAADTDNLPLVKDGETLAIINFQNEDDWTRHGDWYYYNYEVEPGQSTNSLLKSVTLNCDANMGKDNVCTETPTGVVCEKPEDSYESATYHLNVTVQTTSGEFPREDEFYDVTINPNGGTFQGSSEPYVASLQYGTEVDLSSIAYADHEFNGWTLSLNGEEQAEPYTEGSITIDDHTTLTANWRWGIFHDVTVNPNGGSLDGSTEPVVTSVRHADSFTLPTTEPTREDYLFDGWAINGSIVSDSSISVLEDTELVAQWSPVVARIESTGTLFRSVTAANTSASSGDTITLLKDTEEEATITKNVTLDLDEHVLSGSITNNGNLTLLNGEVNNDSGAAVTNNGTLTMGVDDHDFDGDAHIVSDYVRLIGADTGLDQNGIFNFYDGFIEGEIALDGGYDGSPFFRKAFDEEVVYYFPFVDNVNDGEMSYQHAELESSDLAVSKTAVHGDIYYYSIQDNINTSLRTGYKIYIVRDDFDTGEALTVPAGGDITIDIDGHNFTATDTITVNGKLTIEDSKTTIETVSTRAGSSMPSVSGNVFVTPHDEEHTITTVTYAGNIATPQTTIVNGELVMNKAKMTGTTVNDAVSNNGAITMVNGALGTTTGYTIRKNSSGTESLDDNSYLFSTSSDKAAVYITNQNFAWSKGNIYGAYQAIYAAGAKNNSTTVTINGGTVYGSTYGIYGADYTTINIDGATVGSAKTGVYTNGSSTSAKASLVLSDGTVKVESSSAQKTVGIHGSSYDSLTMSNGSIQVSNSATGYYDGYGIELDGYYTPVSITGGSINMDINATTCGAYDATSVYGIYVSSSNNSVTHSIKNLSLSVQSPACTVYGIRGKTTLQNSTVTVSGSNTAYGVKDGATNISNSTISATTTSSSKTAYGVSKNTTYTITNSVISASAPNSTAYGIQEGGSGTATVIGGKVAGDTYGIISEGTSKVILGANDGTLDTAAPEIIGGGYALYGNAFSFYDGILRGKKTGAYQEGSITAIPDAMTFHIEETAEYKENCWLVDAENYLQVGDAEYNSLAKAYDAITGDTGTIKVIKDTAVEAILPTSPSGKTITFDLNGHQLIYSQPIINGGNMIITDSDPDKSGKLLHPKADASTIINNGVLTIESGYITAGSYGVYNNAGSTLTMNDGTIQSASTGIYLKGANNNPASATLNGGTVYGSTYGIYGADYTTINIDGATVGSAKTGVYTNGSSTSAKASLVLSDGTVKVESSSAQKTVGIHGSSYDSLTMSNGSIQVSNSATGYYDGYGIELDGYYTPVSITGGSINMDINATTCGAYDATSVYGIYVSSSNNSVTHSIKNLSLSVQSPACTVYGIRGKTTLQNSTVTVSGSNTAYGVKDGATNISNSTISATTTSSSKTAYGVSKNTTYTITNSVISASAPNSTAYGIQEGGSGTATVIGGKVAGDTYGIISEGTSKVILGANDGTLDTAAPEIIGGGYALYGNAFSFYDGILRGKKTGAYQEGSITAIPDAMTFHIEETAEYKENCWLVDAENYLQVGDAEYNSLAKAYDAITGDTGTIKVIKDTAVEAILPTSPSGKTITFDLNGHQLIYSQPIINGGNMIITDSDPDKSGKLLHPKADASTIINNGVLTIESGYITAGSYGVYNNAGSTLTMNDGTIQSASTGIYLKGANNNPASATLNGGTVYGSTYGIYGADYTTINIDGATVGSAKTGVYTNGSSTSAKASLVLSDGTVKVESSSAQKTVGIHGSSYDSLTMSNGSIQVSNSATGYYDGYGIELDGYYTPVSITGGSINMDINATTCGAYDATSVYGIYVSSSNNSVTHSIKNLSLSVQSPACTVYGIRGKTTLQNSTVTVSGSNTAYGVKDGATNISNSTISATTTSSSKTAYGVSKNTTYTITNSVISASAPNSTAYGIQEGGSGTATVIGGKVAGDTYGIISEGTSKVILGANDGTLDTAAPEIIGGGYALYGNAFSFYDGILRGEVGSYRDGIVKAIADNSAIHQETQNIDGIDYETRWLAEVYDVAQIGDTKYQLLSDAITAAETGQTINLLTDNFIFSALTIPSEKDFIINTNGYDLILNNSITNNGKVSVENNSSDPSIIKYYSSDYAVINAADAELNLKNIDVNANYGINNSGALSLDSVSVVTNNTSINNSGNITTQNGITLNNPEYSIYNDGGISTLSEATFIGKYIYNNSGTLTIANSSASITNSDKARYDYIVNKGNLTLDSCSYTLTNTYANNSSGSHYRVMYNTGNLTLNNTTLSHIITHPSVQLWGSASAIYNDASSGTINMANSSVLLDVRNVSKDYSFGTYAIYMPTGSATIESGEIFATGRGNVYGIYTNSGTVVIGVPEPTSSPDYGRDTADVSKTNPDIKAVSTSTSTNNNYKTGIGIKNTSGGHVEFYDGKVSGNTAAFGEAPAVTEHFYEICTETDTSVTPNLIYSQLFWVRASGQSPCSN